MNGYYSTASESEATVASTDRMRGEQRIERGSQETSRKRRDRLRGTMAIQVYPPTWAVAESNDLLAHANALASSCRSAPPRSSNQPEIITFLRVDLH